MKTIYFKTRKAIDTAAKEMDENAKIQSVTCACGESLGYYISGMKLVLCESCYSNASFAERGE